MKFNIRVIPSNITFEASSECSILQSALNSDVYLEHSCKDGRCGKCKAKIVSGRVEVQKASVSATLSDFNDDYIFTCCAKPISDLTLDAVYYPELQGVTSSMQPCKVESLVFPSSDIAILKLKLPPKVGFQFVAGQYIQLIIQGKRRSYSIANISETYAGIELQMYAESGVVSRSPRRHARPISAAPSLPLDILSQKGICRHAPIDVSIPLGVQPYL